MPETGAKVDEIISTLERAREKALAKRVMGRAFPISSPDLDYRAVYEMACDHLTDTVHLFRHARKLEQQLDADERSGLPPARDPRQKPSQEVDADHRLDKTDSVSVARKWDRRYQRWVEVPGKEQDGPD